MPFPTHVVFAIQAQQHLTKAEMQMRIMGHGSHATNDQAIPDCCRAIRTVTSLEGCLALVRAHALAPKIERPVNEMRVHRLYGNQSWITVMRKAISRIAKLVTYVEQRAVPTKANGDDFINDLNNWTDWRETLTWSGTTHSAHPNPIASRIIQQITAGPARRTPISVRQAIHD